MKLILITEKHLLYSTRDIAEIAYELNFQTASHFTPAFLKRITGITPKRIQNNVSEGQSSCRLILKFSMSLI